MVVDISMGSVIEHSSVHEVDEALLSLHNVCLFVCPNYYIAFWYYMVQYSIVCYFMVYHVTLWYCMVLYDTLLYPISIELYGTV